MKYFILIFIGLITLVFITSCGLIYTTKIDREEVKFSRKYGGTYVFDKKLRDEIIQREKERKEYWKSYDEMIEEEVVKRLRAFFTEKEIQDYEDALKKGLDWFVVSYRGKPIYKKSNEILGELYKKYPQSNLYRDRDEKFPQILSNGCKYFLKQKYKETDLTPYFEKIKEYMGDEAYNKLKGGIVVTSYYVDKNGKEIPIIVRTFIRVARTTYGLYGDEGAGFRLTEESSYSISRDNVFYLENGKFIKSDENGEGEWR